MRFQAVNRCLMASVWWASDFRLSTLGLILVVYIRPFIVLIQICKAKIAAKSKPFVVSLLPPSYYPFF